MQTPAAQTLTDSAGCSAACTDDPASWLAARYADIADAQSNVHAPRMRYDRSGRGRFACPELLAHGVNCSHLRRSTRGVTGWLLQRRHYTGDSAEIGVWMGASSMALMRAWPAGRHHHLVDAWRQASNCSCMDRDKHCVLGGDDFEHVYEKVRGLISREYPRRALIVRDLSVSAAANFADQSLDHVYIDARHDYDGVRADLHAWYRKLCPGGLIAGHDFSGGWPGVVRAVSEFVIAHRKQLGGFSITAEGAASGSPSWLVFRLPSVCPVSS
jgi:hypothetical protein